MNLLLLRRLSWRRAIACSYSDQNRTYGSSSTGRRGGCEPRYKQQQQQQQQRRQQQWDYEPYSSTNSRPQRRRIDKPPRVQLRRPGQQHTYLVSCHPGLEQVTAVELQQPGLEAAQGVEVIAPGRVAFSSDSLAGGYAAALCLRSATRVLHLVHEEDLNPNRAAGDTVYEATREGAPWQQLLQPGQTLGVHCMHFYNNSNVSNSQLVARRVRDAVCDSVRDAR
eukprot:GHRQ01007585.1.p1 GENE.GHRQ01007585.1~~GHRQ01007585.1.p1  ORF type:complete len:223 (+),score=50.67 GHRQ01007585.1:163-831(+)